MNTNTTETLVKATSVIGLKVLSTSNGLQFTKVKDIMYDPYTQRVAYLITDEGGWFREAKVIPFSSIDIIGPDRVMVPGEHVEVKVSKVDYDLNTLIQNDDIIKNLNIVTENGEKLGKVVDFYFDAQTGAVREFEISQGLINNITNGPKILRVKGIKIVGVDAVIVEPEISEEFQEQAEHLGIKGVINATTTSIADTAEAAKSKLGDLAEATKDVAINAKDKVVETTSNAVEATKPYVEKAKDAAIATKDKLVETGKNIADSTQPYVEKAQNVAVDTKNNVADAVKNNTPNSKEELAGNIKEKADELKENVQQKTDQVRGFVSDKIADTKEAIEQYQINKVIGFTLTRDIIDPKTNEIVAMKGDVIDAEVINKAKALGVLHLVVDEISHN